MPNFDRIRGALGAVIGGVWRAVASGETPDERPLGAANAREEADRRFEVFTSTGGGGHGGMGGTTPPSHSPNGIRDRGSEHRE
jgi:hypothetical protein